MDEKYNSYRREVESASVSTTEYVYVYANCDIDTYTHTRIQGKKRVMKVHKYEKRIDCIVIFVVTVVQFTLIHYTHTHIKNNNNNKK